MIYNNIMMPAAQANAISQAVKQIKQNEKLLQIFETISNSIATMSSRGITWTSYELSAGDIPLLQSIKDNLENLGYEVSEIDKGNGKTIHIRWD